MTIQVTGYIPDVNGISVSRTSSPESVSSPTPGPSGLQPDSNMEDDEGDIYTSIMTPLQYDSIEFASMIC